MMAIGNVLSGKGGVVMIFGIISCGLLTDRKLDFTGDRSDLNVGSMRLHGAGGRKREARNSGVSRRETEIEAWGESLGGKQAVVNTSSSRPVAIFLIPIPLGFLTSKGFLRA